MAVEGWEKLLQEFAPLLRYHEQERFRATRIESMVEASPPAAALPDAVTELRDGKGEALASTDPGSGLPQLSVDLLRKAGTEYPGLGVKADRRHYLAGSLPGSFAFTGPPIAYGRARDLPDGKVWLQYWLFSYDNPHHIVGNHQGDWELVQVKVDPHRSPGEGGLLAATAFSTATRTGAKGATSRGCSTRTGACR
jgi:hypothetical protein